MAWVYLDDNFPNHPKLAEVSPVAAFMFVCGLCYCKRYNTNGRIPAAEIRRLVHDPGRNSARYRDQLVSAGLWELRPPLDAKNDHPRRKPRPALRLSLDAIVHDWDQWNGNHEGRSERGRKAAQARWSKRPKNASSNGQASSPQMLSDALSLPEEVLRTSSSGIARRTSGDARLVAVPDDPECPTCAGDRWVFNAQTNEVAPCSKCNPGVTLT